MGRFELDSLTYRTWTVPDLGGGLSCPLLPPPLRPATTPYLLPGGTKQRHLWAPSTGECVNCIPREIRVQPLCPWAALVAQMAKRLPPMRETWVQSLGWEEPLKKEMTTHSSTPCLENPMDRGAWQARAHGVAKSRTQLSDFTSALPLGLGVLLPSRLGAREG